MDEVVTIADYVVVGDILLLGPMQDKPHRVVDVQPTPNGNIRVALERTPDRIFWPQARVLTRARK